MPISSMPAMVRTEHPTQALLDAYSIREQIGKRNGKVPENFNGLKVAILGDILHSRVALPIFIACKKWVLRSWSAGLLHHSS